MAGGGQVKRAKKIPTDEGWDFGYWWSWGDSGEFPAKSAKVLINQGLGRNTTKLHYVRYTEGG